MSEDSVDRRALAVELLGSKRPPLLVIWCGARDGGHRLGAVYDTGDVAGRVVAMRSFRIFATELYDDPQPEVVRSTAYAFPLDVDDAAVMLGMCEHGTYHVDRARILEWLAHPAWERGPFIAAWSARADG